MKRAALGALIVAAMALSFFAGRGLGQSSPEGRLVQAGVQQVTVCPWKTHQDVNLNFPGEHEGSWVKKRDGDCHTWYHVTN
jgi:hypothetical protein